MALAPGASAAARASARPEMPGSWRKARALSSSGPGTRHAMGALLAGQDGRALHGDALGEQQSVAGRRRAAVHKPVALHLSHHVPDQDGPRQIVRDLGEWWPPHQRYAQLSGTRRCTSSWMRLHERFLRRPGEGSNRAGQEPLEAGRPGSPRRWRSRGRRYQPISLLWRK